MSVVANINRSMAYNYTNSTGTKRSTKVWKDLNLNFTKHPTTNDIVKLEGVNAVKRSVRNLINLNHYEKPFHPEIGSNVRDILFEPMTPLTEVFLAKKIEEVLINHEPRVRLVRVNVNSNPEQNRYRVWIEFYVVNHPEPVTVETFLERLR